MDSSKYIEEILKARKIQKKQFCRELGISVSTLRYISLEIRIISPPLLRKMCENLKIDYETVAALVVVDKYKLACDEYGIKP